MIKKYTAEMHTLKFAPKNCPPELMKSTVSKSVSLRNLEKEKHISIKAGKIVSLLYNAFLKQYKNPESAESLHSLNVLCVRLVFCFYADSVAFFGRKGMFHDYLERFDTRGFRRALIALFEVLDTQLEKRDPYLDSDLAAFPYVSGGLFADRHIEIPFFTEEIRDLILNKASRDFDWSEISPTIFGAVFESTLNPAVRRSGGMHYTSIENIHKVIDPLFLDELKNEYEQIREIRAIKTQRDKLEKFQQKLASLKWLDPACGSGNFLTETFISIRKLENKVIASLIELEPRSVSAVINPVRVSTEQFYGIEINDFATTVAKITLWIAESQMMKQTEDIIHMSLKFPPLKTYANIIEANALRIDWESVVPKNQLNYIIGNPPFVGASYLTDSQRKDMETLWDGKRGKLDYVSCWYVKSADLMAKSKIKTAFVSTNSITQGEQTTTLWKRLFNQGIVINFAYRTFKWNSEASERTAVHCVIIGFSTETNNLDKYIFINNERVKAKNINPYLIDAPTIFIASRGSALCDVPKMTRGNQPTDGGNLILSQEERDELIKKDPSVSVCVRRYIGARDYINNDIVRYCLWLKDISPTIYHKNAEIMRRLEAVKEIRLASSSASTRAFADKPYIFFSTPQNNGNYLCIPEVSSERRKYIPTGFMDENVIASNKLLIIHNATIYDFGILTSNVHMAWMRTVAGRLKSDYSYANGLVYNTFPWPTPTEAQKAKIEKTAQAILDARELYPESSLADLYDPLTMPKELLRAHQANDKAVMAAYGWKPSDKAYQSESECVAELMKMYQKLTELTVYPQTGLQPAI